MPVNYILYSKAMFAICHHIKGLLLFQHAELKSLSSEEKVFKKIKKTFEGRCLPDKGYLIQIMHMRNLMNRVSNIRVERDGIHAEVSFDCLTFKRNYFLTQQKRATSLTSSWRS